MFGSETLDIVIGLVFFFLFASLICSAVREGLESILKMRALDLERAVRELLADKDGTLITGAFFQHPMISALFMGEYDPAMLKKTKMTLGKGNLMHMPIGGRRNLPSYIPAANFAQAVLSLVAQGALSASPPPSSGDTTLSAANIRASIGNIASPQLKQALLSAFDLAKGDIDATRTNLENWFNSSMDRVSGWYKRRTQLFLFLIGLVAAAALNLDAVNITRHMVLDKNFRDLVVKEAEFTVTAAKEKNASTQQSEKKEGTPPSSAPPASDEKAPGAGSSGPVPPTLAFDELHGKLEEIGFPIGWTVACPKGDATKATTPAANEPPAAPVDQSSAGKKPPEAKACTDTTWRAFTPEMLLGWLITAIAVMFGAPFWIDVLNKLVRLRAAGKEPPKDGTEAADAKKAAAK